jgi:hypothetical protein
VVNTSFGAADPAGVQRWLVPVLRPFMKSSFQGAATSVYLAASPELERVTGQFWAELKPKKSSPHSYDNATAGRLWRASTRLVGLERTDQEPVPHVLVAQQRNRPAPMLHSPDPVGSGLVHVRGVHGPRSL